METKWKHENENNDKWKQANKWRSKHKDKCKHEHEHEHPRRFKISKKDISLLKVLRENARLSLTQISKKIKIPISTLFDRLKLMERNSLIRHTTLVDFSKFGFSTKVHFSIKTPSKTKKIIQSFLNNDNNINSVYEMADEYQLFAEGIFENIISAQQFREHLEEQFEELELKTRFIVKNIKQESFHISS